MGPVPGQRPDSTANSNCTAPGLERDEELAKAEIGVLATILVVATAGNAAVVVALGRPGLKRSRMHVFVLHLAVTDLGVAVFQVLPQLAWDVTFRFQGPDLLCRAVKYLQVLSMFASTYMLLVMTLDRYLAICRPLRTLRQPGRSAYPLIAATWTLAAGLSLPQLFIFSLREVSRDSGVLDCWAHFRVPWGPRAYVTWTTLAIFVLPVAVLTACYGLICHEICKNLRGKSRVWGPGAATAEPSGPSARVSSVRAISRAKIRTVKMTFVIVLAYVACWAPFFSVQMWSVWDENIRTEDSSDVAFTITMLLGSLSSCCNPWIYMSFSNHLLPESLRCFSCLGAARHPMKRQLSNGSLSSRRTALLTRSRPSNLCPSGGPLPEGSLKDFCPPHEYTVTETGVL
ncbi:vasopressin V1b receptor [Ornithorhynchus anatinus]|uniref:Vasopressin V1b receptor n=1 Tax=Ornithorhynchus anatinus TaxID=9258 RepID=A0A6I8PKC3_ORNAN|nr:vasopressin V1b receptor [Ornithorhynchus anatinus]